jgi:hypothetical protein
METTPPRTQAPPPTAGCRRAASPSDIATVIDPSSPTFRVQHAARVAETHPGAKFKFTYDGYTCGPSWIGPFDNQGVRCLPSRC